MKALRRAAARGGFDLAGRYVELRQVDGSLLLLFAFLAGGALPDRLAEARVCDADKVAFLLSAWSFGMRDHGPPIPEDKNRRCRPVNAGAGWRMPKAPPTGNWRTAGGAPSNDREVVLAALHEVGVTKTWESVWPEIEGVCCAPAHAWSFDFQFSPADKEKVLTALALADDPPKGDVFHPEDGS